MNIPFTKMHGIGNDFIVINRIDHPADINEKSAQFLCDRRFGIGADQILIVDKPDIDCADFKMGILNADGSEVEMCGNGIRCVAKYIVDNKLSSKQTLAVQTLAGIMYPQVIGENVRVNMGKPRLVPNEIPVNYNGDTLINKPFIFDGKEYRITAVSMGNPHCVIFVDSYDGLQLDYIGPIIERDAMFPKRTNVEFVRVLSPAHIEVKVWERGSGITLACGTGACACAVASVLNEKTGRDVKVSLPGGDLNISWDTDGTVYMDGPAEKVFDGIINI